MIISVKERLGDTGRDFALIGGIRSLDKHLVGEIRRRDEKFIVVMLPGQILVLARMRLFSR